MITESVGIVPVAASILGNTIADIIKVKFDVSKDSSVQKINEEVSKQNIVLELAQQQARVAQELAIALRIETADEVEVEEFYDNVGEGNVGLKGTKEEISFGISGSGRKIVKRIYKFKGHNGKNTEVYEQKLSDILSNKIEPDVSRDQEEK
ncbi:MAG: hypothetical protein E7211_08665 [Clostridium lundense]|nr:hypothetical protein [Clostridium lundense]